MKVENLPDSFERSDHHQRSVRVFHFVKVVHCSHPLSVENFQTPAFARAIDLDFVDNFVDRINVLRLIDTPVDDRSVFHGQDVTAN